MNFKTTYVLFGLLGALLVVFGFMLWQGPTEPPDVSAYVLPTLHDPNNKVQDTDVTAVEIERSRPTEERLAFVRDPSDGKGWKMTRPHEFRVDDFQVTQIVNQVLGAKKEVTADVTSNPETYALSPPAATVTLRQGDREWKLHLGREGQGQGAVVYVNSSDRKEPMAVRKSSLDALYKSVNDFRAKELLASSAFDIQQVEVRHAKQGPVVLRKASEGRWRFEKPEGFGEAQYQGETAAFGADKKDAPSTNVSDLLQALANARPDANEDFVESDAKDLAKYGLEEGKQAGLRVEVRRSAGFGGEGKPPVTAVLLTGKEVEGSKGEEVYARLADEKHVVKVDAKHLKPAVALLEKPGEFRDRDLVHIDTGRVDAIDLKTAAGQQIELRKVDRFDWKMWVDGGKPQKVHEPAVQDLLTALTGKRLVKDFPDPKSKEADLGLDKPTAVIALWEDAVQKDETKEESKAEADGDKKDEKKEEKKDPDAKPALKADRKDKPTVRLTFGSKEVNRGVIFARREAGEDTTLVAVQDTLAPTVTRGPLAYRERRLEHFEKEDDVTRITVARADGTYEVVKEKKGDKDAREVWKLAQPKEMEGRTAGTGAVRDVLGTLRFLQVVELENEKPTEQELEQKYGLKSPPVKVTVTVTKDNKPEEHVYLFGKEAANGVYAKQGKSDLVFVVGKETLRPLNAALQDPTIFSFDAAKVKTLKLVGWQDVAGTAVTLEMERKSPTEWVMKAPKEFNLDAEKVQKLVADLANLRADDFVGPKSLPAAEQFELKNGALQIELTVEGEKEPLALTVGGLDADKKRYYARSNRLPGQVFLVQKERFENAKSKPAAFSK